jgi:hypothetical protein
MRGLDQSAGVAARWQVAIDELVGVVAYSTPAPSSDGIKQGKESERRAFGRIWAFLKATSGYAM